MPDSIERYWVRIPFAAVSKIVHFCYLHDASYLAIDSRRHTSEESLWLNASQRRRFVSKLTRFLGCDMQSILSRPTDWILRCIKSYLYLYLYKRLVPHAALGGSLVLNVFPVQFDTAPNRR